MTRGMLVTSVLLTAVGVGGAVVMATSRRKKAKARVKGAGFTVGPNCTLVVQDLEQARASAYAAALAGPTHDEAVAKVFGGCGVQEKMQLYGIEDAKNLFWLGYEVARGSIAAGRLDPAVAQAQLDSIRAKLALYGVDTSTLPNKF